MPTNFEIIMSEYAAEKQRVRDGSSRDRQRLQELYRRREDGFSLEEELALQLAWIDQDAATYETNLDLCVADCTSASVITQAEYTEITGREYGMGGEA